MRNVVVDLPRKVVPPLSVDEPAEVLLGPQKQALEMIVSGVSLREILSFLTFIVEHYSSQRVVAAILLLDAEGCLRQGAGPSLPDAYHQAIDGLKARADLGTCSVAAVTGEVVITEDIGADPKWHSIKNLPLGLGLRAAWSQPIVAGDGRVLGTFGTYFRECRGPSPFERQLVAVLSQTAALAIVRDRADQAKEQQRRILDVALDAAEMGIWHYTFASRLSKLSPRAQSLYGIATAAWVHDDDWAASILHPDDVPVRGQKFQQACDPGGTGRYSAEYRIRRPEGGWRWLSVWGVVEFEGVGPDRKPVTMVGASRDITAAKESERRQNILVDELSHRVKNVLAIIQSIARQTLRHTPDPINFHEAFSARLDALARTHSLLTNARWQEISLDDLVQATVAPFAGDRQDSFIRVDGLPVRVEANTAVMISLVLNELATNAAKYGALTAADGYVEVLWERSVSPCDGPEMLSIVWKEHGGPKVTAPVRTGLGSKLMTASAKHLGGDVSVEFQSDGLRCIFRFPLST